MGNTCGALVAALRREERHAPGPQYTRLGQSEPEGKEHTERGIDAPAVVRNLGQPLRIVTEMGGSTESSIGGASMHGSMEGVSRRRWGLDVDLSRPGDDRTTGLAGTAFAGAGGGSTGFDPSGTGKEQQSNSYGAVAAAAGTAAAAAERGFHKGMRVSLLQKHCVVDSVLAVFQCKHSRFASGSLTRPIAAVDLRGALREEGRDYLVWRIPHDRRNYNACQCCEPGVKRRLTPAARPLAEQGRHATAGPRRP